MLRFFEGEDHDPSFIALIRQIGVGLLRRITPHEAFVVQIDNWFDHDWLDLRTQKPESDQALDKYTVVPMFNPARVAAQDHYVRRQDSDLYVSVFLIKEVHGFDGLRHGRHRRIVDLTEDAIFLWYSGRTTRNGRGSLMVYVYTPSSKFSWYASLVRRGEWVFDRAQGIGPTELRRFADGFSDIARRD